MYNVESFSFSTAAQAADCITDNTDWHHLCQIGISEREYALATWLLRNYICEQLEQLPYGSSAKIAGYEVSLS